MGEPRAKLQRIRRGRLTENLYSITARKWATYGGTARTGEGKKNAGNRDNSRDDKDWRTRGYPIVADRCGASNNGGVGDWKKGKSKRVGSVGDIGAVVSVLLPGLTAKLAMKILAWGGPSVVRVNG